MLPSFVLVKGFSKLIDNNPARSIPDEIHDAKLNLSAKQKFTPTYKAKAPFKEKVSCGDLIKIFDKIGMNEREIPPTPKAFLSIDYSARSIILPGKSRGRVTAAVEGIIMALSDDISTSDL